MLLFGHVGITAGIVKALELLESRNSRLDAPQSGSGSRPITTSHQKLLFRLLSSVNSRIGSIDYRFVMIGSLLPDIIDKPLWFFTAGNIFASGRDYSHTFLLNLGLFIGGLIWFNKGNSRLLMVSLGSFMHLILDRMWYNPVALWWPLLGPFPKAETAGWALNLLQALLSNTYFFVSEIIGLIIVISICCRLVARKGVINFLRNGVI